MLDNFSLIRNVGKFNSVNAGANLDLNGLALIYAENGRGKTTLAIILRSLGDKEPLPIIERKRLGGLGEPHIIIAIRQCSIMEHGAIVMYIFWYLMIALLRKIFIQE